MILTTPGVVSTSEDVWSDLLLFPARSVACTTILCLPSAIGSFGCIIHLPSSPALVVPITLPLSKSSINAPFSAVPSNTGLLSFVRPPLTSPLYTPPSTLSVMLSIVGLGVTVSTSILAALLGLLFTPRAFSTTAVMLCLPSGSAALTLGVNSQLPLVLAFVVPIKLPLS